MKYHPACSAHWEGPVGQWLRAQLDSRGIDALAYGRYVLSLLTGPLDPADLSPSPIGNKIWERRNRSDWAPVKIEALKRSAAVQCLLNACDDRDSGIEELVDELCSKLKRVEEVDDKIPKREPRTAKSSRRERSRPPSPREMARQYYAAFPALVPSETDALIRTARVDAPGCDADRHRNKNAPSHRQNFGADREFSRSKKCAPRERNGSERNAFRSHHGHHKQRKPRRVHCRAEELPEWVDDGDVWDMESHDFARIVDEGYGTRDNTVVDEVARRPPERDAGVFFDLDGDELSFSKVWGDGGFEFAAKSPSEDESIARFEAKFDRSLEALWPKEFETSADRRDRSPSDGTFDRYSADRPLPISLADSIWSDNGDFAGHASSKRIGPWENHDAYDGETMEVIYNKLRPLNLDDPEESADVDANGNSFSAALDGFSREPSVFSFRIHQPPVGTPARGLNVLNHDSLYSSFTEVIPKAPSGYVGDGFVRKNDPNPLPDLSKPFGVEEDEKDEEDLLTSMRTHFKPIKREPTDCSRGNVEYADGMTFPVVSDLDRVKFSRSDSGNIFLESDNEPPAQYMEYREQGIDYTRLDISSSSICSDDSMSSKDLVLKFKVCQTEKSIQTDNLDAIKTVDSSVLFANEPVPTSRSGSDANPDADKEIESLDLHWIRCDECKANYDRWNVEDWNTFKLDSSRIWSSDDTSCKTCAEQQAKTEVKQAKKDKIYEEETAREWDELLSDLRYIHDRKSDADPKEELNTPTENCYIAPSEISIKAADGNFVKSALLAEKSWTEEGKNESNIVGKILDHSLIMYSNVEPHCEACIEDTIDVDDASVGWRVDRKRRHSAVSGGRTKGVRKLRCTLTGREAIYSSRPLRVPLLPTADRPLTR